jgi:hypothetical protein
MRTTLPLLAALLAAAPLAAQDCDCHDPWLEDEPTGGYLGGGLTLASMQGEFAEYVDGGIGFDLHYLHRLDRDGWLAVRVEGGMLIYGYETHRVPLSNTLGGRIMVDLNTSNNIAFIGVGPQIGVPDGRFRPYLNGYAGYSYIWTGSSVRGSWDQEPFAETTNFSDWTFSYGGGGGVYVPLSGGPRPVSLDLGVRYQNNGRAEYLLEGGIQDNPDGSITLFPVRSDTDVLTFRVGVSVGVTRSR